MFKIDGESLFTCTKNISNNADLDVEKCLAYRLGKGLPPGLQVLDSVEENISVAKDITEKIGAVSRVVVLATGGSSLGGQAVCALSKYLNSNKTAAPAIEFWENIDPREMMISLSSIDFSDTAFVSISKSGETPETLSQTAIVINKFLSNGISGKDLLRKRLFAITQSSQSSLGKLMSKHGISTLPHPQKVGGRFSVFSIVGILPTVIAGLDAFALCEGAKDVLECLREQNQQGQALFANISAIAQMASNLNESKKINSCILMHYGDGLSSFSRWFAQLWAESLGKQCKGILPAIACGTVDQHSQLQLYLDGPNDKLFTIIGVSSGKHEGCESLTVKGLSDDMDAKYLDGYGLNEIFSAERDAVIETLIQEGRRVRYIELLDLSERSLGQLMAYFMLEVVITADMMKVDAFDQPAVEKSKRLLKRKLSTKCQ